MLDGVHVPDVWLRLEPVPRAIDTLQKPPSLTNVLPEVISLQALHGKSRLIRIAVDRKGSVASTEEASSLRRDRMEPFLNEVRQ